MDERELKDIQKKKLAALKGGTTLFQLRKKALGSPVFRLRLAAFGQAASLTRPTKALFSASHSFGMRPLMVLHSRLRARRGSRLAPSRFFLLLANLWPQ